MFLQNSKTQNSFKANERLLQNPPKLYALQETVVNDSLARLAADNYALLKLGQRSGKTLMASEIIRRGDYKYVYVFGLYKEVFSTYSPVSGYFCGRKIPRSLVEGEIENAVALIDEAMWLEDSYDIFNEVRQYVPTIAISSNGPEYIIDKRWKTVSGISHATWELNACIPNREQLEQQIFGHLKREEIIEEMGRFERDFCAY